MKGFRIFKALVGIQMLILMSFSVGKAQCDFVGLVFQDNACTNLYIQTSPSSTDVLEVVDDGGWTIEPGDIVFFSYDMANVSSCQGYPPIELTCLEVDTMVVGSCEADIHAYMDWGGDTYWVQLEVSDGWTPFSYEWYLDGVPVSTASTYEGTLADEGKELCVALEMVSMNGDSCSTVACELLNFSPNPYTCVDSTIMDTTMSCMSVYAPVCGCNQVTYANECEAFYYGGVTSYIPGPCSDTTGCVASFDLSISANDEYVFTNTSSFAGADAFSIWFVSDSTFVEDVDTFTHVFEEDGSYMVCLLAGDDECMSAACQVVVIGDSVQVPMGGGLEDYVFPGDADQSGAADLADVLYVGLGYDSSGFPRPGASNDWYGQMSFDWAGQLNGINYKHFDCDGDGEVDYLDVNSILLNSQPLPEGSFFSDPALPPVYLKFNQDTIIVTDNSPNEWTISADLMLGSGQTPVYDLAGIALGIDYPDDLVNKPAMVDYYDNSMLGSSNELLWLANDFMTAHQLDMTFVRNDQSSKNGYGKIAKVDIIIDDVITLRTEKYIEVPIRIKSIRAVDAEGHVKEFSVKNNGTSTVVFVNNTTVGSLDPAIQGKVKVYPSPATREISVVVDDLHPIRLEVYDVLAQKVYTLPSMDGNKVQIEMEGWASGQYILKLYAEEGLVVKRIVKE